MRSRTAALTLAVLGLMAVATNAIGARWILSKPSNNKHMTEA